MNIISLKGTYKLSCIRQGVNIWNTVINNGIVTVGKNNLLDNYFAGSSYSAAFYLGLIDNTGSIFAASDTMASHAGWNENSNYDEATRPIVTWGSASGASKSSNSLTFSINSNFTLQGCFLSTNNVKGGTTGILFSSGAFSVGANRSVEANDILTVTYTISC